jgi:hypothetical protein
LQRRQSGGGKQQQTKFCHDGVGPRKILGRKALQVDLGNNACHQDLTINEQALGRIVAGFGGVFVFISDSAKPHCGFVHDAFSGSFKTVCSRCPCGISAWPDHSGHAVWHASI